ncbi:hypothetical protein QYE76_001822 [Lolium multiflorum]|uniref:Reverse transcriptase Ty1/copia-type domain-containing protein n=1 Tax=Lolium multiflorum TaxID=4521 RepID=A0AAD8RNK4_LOLMU|nr:hypothetical protein QYE76_001822 [Lolium multiflorum]
MQSFRGLRRLRAHDSSYSGEVGEIYWGRRISEERKFEMSMMGELKFFLGFQVRQLAKGTFISQEKYVKDMLKKFNMTNASPMKTPMPMKGQLGSCDGEKDVDIKDLRTVNPYRYEQRTYTGGDKFFWTKTQAALWVGYYDNTHECMKNGVVVKPKAINPEELALHEATKYRFVVQTLKGLLVLLLLLLMMVMVMVMRMKVMRLRDDESSYSAGHEFY